MGYANSADMLQQAGIRGPLPGNPLTQAAMAKYRQACRPTWKSRLRSALRGHSNRLLRLSDFRISGTVCGGHYAGLRSVSILQIQGSEGRCEDFDAEFRPLRSHNRGRWLNVARARLQGVALPPVELIQIGKVYFVRDGHHRISVAKAFGQEVIDAEVTVWEVAPVSARESPAPAVRLISQVA